MAATISQSVTRVLGVRYSPWRLSLQPVVHGRGKNRSLVPMSNGQLFMSTLSGDDTSVRKMKVGPNPFDKATEGGSSPPHLDDEYEEPSWKPTGRARRPKRIIVVRHEESAGNDNEAAYVHTPDWKVPLTLRGVERSRLLGVKLKKLIGEDPVYFYVSPYLRALQTCQGIINAFPDEQIVGVREEPRIVEQQFGNFQNVEEIKKAKRERWRYGTFFFRFPNGESGLDVYSRVTDFIATMHRDFGNENIMRDDLTMIIVTHGLALRLFLMRWFLYTVHDFEQTQNPINGGYVVMDRNIDAKGNEWFDLTEQSLKMVKFPKYTRHAFLLSPKSRDFFNRYTEEAEDEIWD